MNVKLFARLILLALIGRWTMWIGAHGLDEDSEDSLGSYVKVIEGPINSNRTEIQDLQQEWVDEAILNVAYFLRHFRFNEFDRRFEMPTEAHRNLYIAFPSPPLRSFHWEVHEKCWSNLIDCLYYLDDIIDRSPLKRSVDVYHQIYEKELEMPRNEKAIKKFDLACQEAMTTFEEDPAPFESFLERFRWSLTASYYMCLYTMKRQPPLSAFGEPCDNFAECFNPEYPTGHGDPRADDKQPFACARYSFCPDPCCPMRHVNETSDCWENGPCIEDTSGVETAIGVSRENSSCIISVNNYHLPSIVLNHWNVSCNCTTPGFTWDSRYGMCVDVDECMTLKDGCRPESESCLNTAGGYTCTCRWGYTWNEANKTCIVDSIVVEISKQKKPVFSKDFLKNFTIRGKKKKIMFNISTAQDIEFYEVSMGSTQKAKLTATILSGLILVLHISIFV